MVPGKCSRSDKDYWRLLFSCGTYHDRVVRIGLVHEQRYGHILLCQTESPDSDHSQFMTTAFLHRRCTIVDLLINWVVSFFGNLAGMLFFMAIITGCEQYHLLVS